jgi:hypothetical protein
MHGSSDHRFRKFKSVLLGRAFVTAPIALALIFCTPKAGATPTFARQTGRNCSFCHSGVPRLNDTGVAFKNNGFLLPDSNKAPDKDHKDAPAQ